MAAIDNPAFPTPSNLTLQVTSSAGATGQPVTTAGLHFISDKGTLPINYQILSTTPNIGSWSGLTFTQNSVNAGTVKYIPLNPNYTTPQVKVSIRLTDPNPNGGSPVTKIFTINYTIPDTAPAGKVGGLTVEEGQCKTFSRAQIDFVDLYQGDAGIIIKVMAWPDSHGNVYRGTTKLGPGSTFTMEDVLNGLISYCHTQGDESTTDSFSFKVRDSNGQWTGAALSDDTNEALGNVFVVPITIIQHDEPLHVTKTGPVKVDQCATVIIDETLIEAVDEDDPTLPITYIITQLPMAGNTVVGVLKKNGSPVSIGTTFTLADLQGDAITYEQDCSNTPLVSFFFKAQHSKQETVPSQFDIRLIPAVPPKVDIIPLTVNECNAVETGKINDALVNIEINDPDHPNPVDIKLIFVAPGPTKGALFMLPSTTPMTAGGGIQFTYQDILDKKLAYKHDCSGTPYADELHFEIVEQSGNVPFTLPVKIIHVDVPNLPLEVTKFGPATATLCGEVVIGPDLLAAQDTDNPELEILFKLTVLPLHGTLFRGVSPAGVELALGDTLTQAEIIAGGLYYVQDCSDTPEDNFHFDTYHPETMETVTDTVFKIFLAANLVPTVSVSPLTVEKCKSAVATEVNIAITDPEGLTPDKIVIEYVEPLPLHGKFLLGGIEIIPGIQFNYDLVITPKTQLVYQHDCTTHSPWTDEAHFKIIDGPLEVPFTLPIIVLHTDDKPPYMTKNEDELCSRTGTVDFNFNKFDFTDPDTDPSQVFWEATALPQYGTFKISGVDLTVGAKFARTEWEPLQFSYVANNVALSVLEDFVVFKLSDATNVVPDLRLRIQFPPAPVNCPDIINNPLDAFRGQLSTIPETDLSATTDGIDSDAHVFTLLELPLKGQLQLNTIPLLVNDTFTQTDINNMLLQYLNTDPSQEFDTFRAQVNNGGCVKTFVFTIHFLPGLKIDINRELEVTSGATGTIDETYLLSSSGTVGNPINLVYKITKLTIHGVVQLNGSPLALDGTFTQADINAHVLTYVSDGTNVDFPSDEFAFEVTDGFETRNDIFDIKILLPDLPPVLEIIGLTVGELRCGSILSPDNIKVTDRESSKTPENLVFTIDEYVEFGEIHLLNVPLVEGNTFTYDDILDGRVSYCNTTPGVLLDSFEFTLRDAGGNEIVGQLFPITIIPPPAPELVNNKLTTLPCTKRTINSTFLNVKNLTSLFPRANMIFTIQSLPTRGTLSFNNTPMVAGQAITLADIISSKLTYIGGSYESVAPDFFNFDVSDGLDGAVFEQFNNVFNIEFTITDNPPWLCMNSTLIIFEYETKAITQDNLQICDVDLDAIEPTT